MFPDIFHSRRQEKGDLSLLRGVLHPFPLKNPVYSLSYRDSGWPDDLAVFDLKEGESDLRILASADVTPAARAALIRIRSALKNHISRHPAFASSLFPVLPPASAPETLRRMARVAAAFSLGPMAAVAGAVADYVAGSLAAEVEEAIVENGGDIHLRTVRPRILGVNPGPGHPLSGRLRIRLPACPAGAGVAASSGRWGRSLSFGLADVAVVFADDAILADAAATALANRVHSPAAAADPSLGDEFLARPGVRALAVVAGELVQFRGELELA